MFAMFECSQTSKTGLQRPAARYDGIGKIGGGYGFLVSMVSIEWYPGVPGYLVGVPGYLSLSLVT